MKYFFSLLACWFFALVVGAVSPAVAKEAGPRVVVTVKPLHSLVAGVMEGVGKPELLVEGRVSPHEFQLKPSQMRRLHEARLLFYISPVYETFLRKALTTLPETVRAAAVGEGSGIALLPLRSGGVWEKHVHAHEHEHEHEHQSGAQVMDMHVWLSPEAAGSIVGYIRSELSAVDPLNAERYAVNAAALQKRLRALDASLAQRLAPLKNRPFVVFHDAYQYLERAYSLRGVGSLTLEPDEATSPARLLAIREKLQRLKAACVFREPYFSDRLVSTAREGTQARAGLLDPEATALSPGPELYFSLMEQLADGLETCLRKK